MVDTIIPLHSNHHFHT